MDRRHALRNQVAAAILLLVAVLALGVPTAFADEALSANSIDSGALAVQAGNIASGTSGSCSWSISASGRLTIKPLNGKSGKLANSKNAGKEFDSDGSSFPWTAYSDRIKSVVFAGGVKGNTSLHGLLEDCHMKSVDLSGLDTSATKDFSCLFAYCSADTVRGMRLDTRNATNMYCMFGYGGMGRAFAASGIKLDTSKVVNMAYMFAMQGGDSLDLSSFKTSKVTDMTCMFASSSFKSIDLSTMDNLRAKCDGMFLNNSDLQKLVTGKSFSFARLQAMPNMASGDGRYWSCASQKWLTAAKVKASRPRAADIYCSAETADMRAANPLKVSGTTTSVKYSKKKASTVKAANAYRFTSRGKGLMTYSRVAKGSSKWLPKVNANTGAIIVKAGAPKGKTQKVVVRVTANGNVNYKSVSKTVTVRVKVR